MSFSPSVCQKAYDFAKEKHKDQVRKYTGEPYLNHLTEVHDLLMNHMDSVSNEMLVAALLHDVVEDQPVTLDEIEAEFGIHVRYLVYCLTDKSKPEDGNRETRKAIDRQHIWEACSDAQTIKLADLISNTASIVEHDKDFAVVYLKEKELLLPKLARGDSNLFNMACETLLQAKLQLNEERHHG